MFDTIVVKNDRKQEVHNHHKVETNIDSSGNIERTENETRFISFSLSSKAHKTVFSSKPYYIERVEKREDPKHADDRYTRTRYRMHDTRIEVKVKQVLIVGTIFTVEVAIISESEDKSANHWMDDKPSEYLNTPTIL